MSGPKKKIHPIVGDPSDVQGFEILIHQYLENLLVKNYSTNTVEMRSDQLRYFKEWCGVRGLFKPIEISKAVVERYQRWLYHYRSSRGERPLSFRSQYMRLAALNQFFRWCSKNNHTLYNPAGELEMPRYERKLPRSVLTAAEADQIINLADVTTELGIRDRTILETFYSTGIRRKELATLTIYDLDQSRGILNIRQGKGKKDRVIPIGERALAWMEKYLNEARPRLVRGVDHGVLFLSTTGEALVVGALTHLVQWYVNKAELNKRGSCHMFRHTMATLMLEGGADIRFIQQMLGHSELSSTEIYTQVSIKKLKEIHSMTHPARLERAVETV